MFPFQYFTAYDVLSELEAKKAATKSRRKDDKDSEKEAWQKV